MVYFLIKDKSFIGDFFVTFPSLTSQRQKSLIQLWDVCFSDQSGRNSLNRGGSVTRGEVTKMTQKFRLFFSSDNECQKSLFERIMLKMLEFQKRFDDDDKSGRLIVNMLYLIVLDYSSAEYLPRELCVLFSDNNREIQINTRNRILEYLLTEYRDMRAEELGRKIDDFRFEMEWEIDGGSVEDIHKHLGVVLNDVTWAAVNGGLPSSCETDAREVYRWCVRVHVFREKKFDPRAEEQAMSLC